MSEEPTVIGAGSSLADIPEGEWAGWKTWAGDAFEQRAGPFYERREADGSMVAAFRAEQRHMNGAGFMHGGCLMTFADSALFTIATDEMADSRGVTLQLAGDFLASVNVGQLVEARGEVTRGGGKTVFVRGMVTADGVPALTFNGIIRKVGKRP
ncbi:PaaI family thioesterase [Tsuneonella mangrovi]|uniref:PaaI family thioesterase n=1 Tax=Tsuneonella mangrovi TaxID=1982042 RepID=UPI000BA2579B|nr:PaaI family thioesterase [Tsuneonella mangrovi]